MLLRTPTIEANWLVYIFPKRYPIHSDPTLELASFSPCYVESSLHISQYDFEKYAVEQGTAMNASLVIFEDLYGYLWLGSQSGVDRFDGYDFINYANVSSDSSSTNLKWVNAIAEDNNGNIWASDQFGNISNYLRLFKL